MTDQTIPEIVAPAGSMECFSATLKAGANAVYAGADGFNMRAGADSLNRENIHSMTVKAHDAGVRLYLAVNVLVFDGEFDQVARTLDDAAASGVDAVILWDMGVLALAKERGLPVHLSTQASVANSLAARWYEKEGVKRIVLARELSLDQVRRTIQSVRASGSSMKFEGFVHGAMCVAVSGRCLASHYLWGRSANRGDCSQPCRWYYRLVDERYGMELALDGHTLLSARDLCTIEIFDRLMNAGLDAFKIEGRMRDARYVKTTVECYRQARDAVLAGVWDQNLAKELKQRLSGVFNRGFSTGFYLRRPDDDIAYEEGNLSTITKQYAGRVVNYYPKAGAADVLLEARGLAAGEAVLVTGPTTGALEFTADSIRSSGNIPISGAQSGALIGLATPEKVRENDRLFVLVPVDAAGQNSPEERNC